MGAKFLRGVPSACLLPGSMQTECCGPLSLPHHKTRELKLTLPPEAFYCQQSAMMRTRQPAPLPREPLRLSLLDLTSLSFFACLCRPVARTRTHAHACMHAHTYAQIQSEW